MMKRGMGVAQVQALPRELENRVPHALLNIDRQRAMTFAQRQPWLASREAEIRRSRTPRNGRPCAVAAQRVRPVGDRFGVLQPVIGNLDLRQAEFLALVNDNRASERA